MRFCPLKPEKTLEIYGVENKSLKDYARDNKKYGFSNLPPISCRMRELEYKGTDDDFEKKKKVVEKELAKVHNDEDESLDMDFGENRFSMTNASLMESDVNTTSSKSSDKDDASFTAMGKDFRGSIAMKRRATVEEVKLEDFDIKSQLGRGTFGRVYLAELSTTKKLYAIKAIRKDVLIEYD